GGRHMRVVRHGTEVMIALDDGPAINFCKPAVDPLFTSATEVWQGSIMSVILTGMGSDGTRGGKDIVAAGGSVIAQDEATSVVWGMPGDHASAGRNDRSEEHTSELQSLAYLVCRLLLEKKKIKTPTVMH